MKRRDLAPDDSPAAPTSLPMLGAILLSMFLVVGALMGFVRLKSMQTEAGYRIHDLRQRLVTLEQQRLALDVERTALSRPARLAYLARTTLGLVPADVRAAVRPTGIDDDVAVNADLASPARDAPSGGAAR